MQKQIIILLTISLFLFGAAAADAADANRIIIAADNWCPFNCTPDSQKPGYMVEVAKEIFEQKGYTLEYQILPWARALSHARKGIIHGVIGPYIEDAPDFVFPEQELAMIGFSIFVEKNTDWVYDGIQSLSLISLGVINDYAYNDKIDNYILENMGEFNKIQISSGEVPLKRNIKKVLAGRMDALLESPPVFLYTAAEMGVKDQLKSAGQVVAPKKAYIGFSPRIPNAKKYAAWLSQGIEEMRKSGRLDEILGRYNLKDWRR